jgi:flagellar motility protein MotE (MotC chaperone)
MKAEIDDVTSSNKINHVAHSVSVLSDTVNNVKTDVRRIDNNHVNTASFDAAMNELKGEIETIEESVAKISAEIRKELAIDETEDKYILKEIHRHADQLKSLEDKLLKTNERFIVITATVRGFIDRLDVVVKRVETVDSISAMLEKRNGGTQ